jgi:TPR repeat protein
MQNKTILTFLALVCIVFFYTGCASAPQTGCSSKQAWYQAGISAEQTRRDLAECQYESLVNGRSYSPIPADTAGHAVLLGMIASAAENSRQNQIVQTCMAAKGYSLVNSNAPFLMNSKPPTSQQSDADIKLFENTKTKAESGDATAQCKLAFYYRSGKGVTTDYIEAFRWYQKAAAQGDAIAQNNLGNCYYDGQGIERDYIEATKWYRKAAEQNNDAAQTSLGVCYFAGQGVTQDYAEAVKWYRKAAEQNLYTAQYYLGSVYANGNGVPKNYIEAYKWYSLSAARGCGEANNDLSIIETRMTPEQIAEGQKLAREFIPQK